MCPAPEPTRSFPKSARLLRRREFLALRGGTSGFVEGPLAASFRFRESRVPTRPGMPPGRARVGITVSSKVGGAVVRNRVKRRIREAVREELALLPAVELVLVARASAVDSSVAEFRAWLRHAARRIAAEVGAS
jgi:ribonuclease P protein component